MTVYVFSSVPKLCEELQFELEEEKVVCYPNLKSASEAEAEYYVFLFTSDNYARLRKDSMACFDAYDDRTIVCCMDDAVYDDYASFESKAYTWWTMDLTQVVSLIKMKAKPFVKQTELEM